jgi:hypothetical protein
MTDSQQVLVPAVTRQKLAIEGRSRAGKDHRQTQDRARPHGLTLWVPSGLTSPRPRGPGSATSATPCRPVVGHLGTDDPRADFTGWVVLVFVSAQRRPERGFTMLPGEAVLPQRRRLQFPMRRPARSWYDLGVPSLNQSVTWFNKSI